MLRFAQHDSDLKLWRGSKDGWPKAWASRMILAMQHPVVGQFGFLTYCVTKQKIQTGPLPNILRALTKSCLRAGSPCYVKRKDVLDFLGNLRRTHYCGELRARDEGRDAVVMGWVHRRRDLGNLLFLDVRDRTGLVQVVFNKETQPAAHARAEQVRSEFVVAVEGRVVKRQKANPELASGEIELVATKLHILNNAKTPPFAIEDEINAEEVTRLRYRYLDLRRPKPHR